MPGLDKTGPMGKGSRTGGGFGLCAGAKTADSLDAGYEELRGMGRGGRPWGGGRGRCFGGGRRGFRNRGMGRRYAGNDEARDDVGFADQVARLIKDNEGLRARLAELESEQKE